MFEINGTMFMVNTELILAVILGMVLTIGVPGFMVWLVISNKSPLNKTAKSNQDIYTKTYDDKQRLEELYTHRQAARQTEHAVESEHLDPILRQMRKLSDTYMRKHYSNKYEITGNHSEYLHVWCKTAEEWAKIDLAAKAEYFIQCQVLKNPKWFHGLEDRRVQRDADYVVYKNQCDALYTQLTEPHLEQKQKLFNSMRRPEPSRYVLETSAIWMNGLQAEKRVLQYTYAEVMKIVNQNQPQQWKPYDWLQTQPPVPDCEGVYVLHNEDDNMYYVGQAVSVHKRLQQHFLGRGGNYDIYADYKYGKQFTIQVYPLKGSGFASLNEQERHYIQQFDAFSNGYNKTHGNA